VGGFFDLVLINPLTNLFVLLNALLGNAGLAVIVITVIIRILTLPLTLKQMQSMRAMGALAPRMQEIQKRHKDPKRRSEEQMKLYREAGINPLGCLSSMLLQFPILIALYTTFRLSLGESPEALIALSDRLYDWDVLRRGLPLNADFLWMNLGRSDPFIIPISVAISTYVLQKMNTLPAVDAKQAAQNQMMNLMMPLIFGWITLILPSGLGLYYVLSNIIGMVLQYFYVGRGKFNWRALVGLSSEPVLPKALEARQAHLDAMKAKFGKNGEEEEQAVVQPTKDGQRSGASARRRRRYAGGKRRGRR
jgi:YidC/Oxa1 family membrane protein insertase